MTCFTHRDCPYFPCHKTADEADFNCLFCYCPLYALGADCGGNFRWTETGVKDCSNCLLPHTQAGYDRILVGCGQIVEQVRRKP